MTNSAMNRINLLLDENSFVEVGAYMTARSTDFNMQAQETPADGVVTGYGTIEGALVYVYSQNAAVMGGSVGEMHAKKIENIYAMAMKMKTVYPPQRESLTWRHNVINCVSSLLPPPTLPKNAIPSSKLSLQKPNKALYADALVITMNYKMQCILPLFASL